VNGVKKFIDQNPGNGHNTTVLARKAGISRNVLQEVFKDRFGSPIGVFRFELRMYHAANYLLNGKSIKEVSFILQYSSPSSFSNAFRKQFDESPSQWLKKNRANANKQGKV
jgi:AraC-like DNA-binding protein